MTLIAIDILRTPFLPSHRDAGLASSELVTRSALTSDVDAAVASWRWDFVGGRSRNLATLVEFSKWSGVETLFVDVVSVDQSLPGGQLVEDVMRFAELYDRIPVLAAYDPATDDQWPRDLVATYRPWIRWEMRRFARSTASVTRLTRGPGKREKQSFKWALESAMRESYANCVLRLAAGVVGMTEPLDFARILAPIAPLVDELHSTLPRNDFFLALALILGNFETRRTIRRDEEMVKVGFVARDISSHFDVPLSRFSTSGHRWHEPRPFRMEQTIRLDGQLVATFRAKMTTSWDREHLYIEDDVLETLAQRLELTATSRDLLINAETLLGDLLPNWDDLQGDLRQAVWDGAAEDWKYTTP